MHRSSQRALSSTTPPCRGIEIPDSVFATGRRIAIGHPDSVVPTACASVAAVFAPPFPLIFPLIFSLAFCVLPDRCETGAMDAARLAILTAKAAVTSSGRG
jgi:hypothetical protein